MKFVDTHTHLYLPEFESEGEKGSDAVRRAVAAGVDRMIFPNVDLTTVKPMQELAAQFPENVFMAMGLHPTEVNEGWQDVLAEVNSYFEDGKKYVAVGEIGIDLYWDNTFEEQQMQVFEQQVASAVERGLPIIIHCREGLDQTLEVLQSFRDVDGVFHSFGGNEKDVEAIRRTGDFYFGINGIVTFKNSKLRETLPAIGLERLLVETDSPYLAPVPHRGKRNESAYIPFIASHIAEHLSSDVVQVAEKTSENAEKLFNL